MIYVTDVHMSGGTKHEHIAAVKWRNPDTGQTGSSDRDTMVKWIDEKGVAKVTDGRNTATVGVQPGPPRYLQTYADGKWSDNLLALPRY